MAARRNRDYRYGAWNGGADPLAPPYDVRAAVDELGREVMEGRSVRDALRDLLRRGGAEERGGLDALRDRVRRRREQLRASGDLAGSLDTARERLAAALDAEREELRSRQDQADGSADADGADPAVTARADDARLREAQLDSLPRRTAAAVRELADYDWASETAREEFAGLLEELREQALRAQLPGLGQRGEQGQGGQGEAGQGGRAGGMEGVKELLGDLNALLGKHARGEDAPEDFAEFMAKHGDAFPEDPQDVEELLDALAQRAAAAERLMRSLSKEQRAELAGLIAAAMEDADLAGEMAALNSQLQDLRPGAFGQRGRARFTGGEPMGLDEATDALSELGELDDLADALDGLDGDRPGSTLDDVDVEAVERQLGPGAAESLRQLAELERELRRQGWVSGNAQTPLSLTPKALRRLGQSALRRVFADLEARRRGGHEERSAGSAGEATGSWREWSFGDEQPLDATATVSRAVLREAARPRRDGAGRTGAVQLLPEDFAVAETEHRASAAVALCVDLSWSMYAEDRWAPMKQTALALAHLVATRYPQDALTVIGFDRTARTLSTAELAAAEPAHVQGTNLAHALALARRHTSRHPSSEPVVLVVTDGEPTAHLEDDGEAFFDWPTHPETLRRTLVEVDALTRSRVAINTFLLGDDPGLRRFADALARRNGGRVLAPSRDRLGEFVVADYLRARAAAGSGGSARARRSA